MKEQKPSIISIGYGRNFFNPGDGERNRMKQCADGTKELHMIIFTNHTDTADVEVVSETLTLHPTATKTRVGMIVNAFLIACSIITKKKNANWIVTTQDPFETALVGLLLKAFYGVRVVVQEHGDFFGHPYWRRESVLNRFRYIFGLCSLKFATRVRVVSKRQKTKLERRGITNVAVFPVAIDSVLYREAAKVTIPGILDNQFVFLSVARFVPQKNLKSLLAAFRGVHQTYPHARLVLVGRGPKESAFKKLLSKWYSNDDCPVTILPWSDNVPGLMKASNVYVLSSHYEGWARVLVEAMTTTLPIVTTDVGCAGEVVKDSVHGLVVPVSDTAALEIAMKRMMYDTAFYQSCKEQLKNAHDIPGTTLASYSRDWLKTFESLE